MNIQLKQKDIKPLRDKLLKEQDNKCCITGKEIENPVLEHHHAKGLGGTGNIRGVADREINVFLGKIENSHKRYKIKTEELPDILRKIADYLERGDYVCQEGHTYKHPSEKPKEPRVSKRNYNLLKKAYSESSKKANFPMYPSSGKLTVTLKKLFEEFEISPYN